MSRAHSTPVRMASLLAICLGATWVTPLQAAPAKQEAEPNVGPRRGAGDRRITQTVIAQSPPATPQAEAKPEPKTEPPEPKPEPPPPPEPKPEAKKPKRPSHQHGVPPRQPRATLPAGSQQPEPNAAVRRQIAGGATAEEQRAGKDDPELRALREAEDVLFPRPLTGATPGWSWDLPRPVDAGQPESATSGVPPGTRLAPSGAPDQRSAADAEWLRSLTMPNLPVRLDSRVIKYLKFYRDSRKGQAIARVWAKKSGRFTPALKAEFAKAGLPTDLVWLSLIESGHNPTIRSPAGAAGLWQFIPETGKAYGLTVDRWVDERLDPKRATQAAIRLLSDLHQRFGNWELAMAAYNMGHGGLGRAIRKFNTNDFWDLSRHEAGIPWETTLYVPKIFAIAIVMNNKQAFGIDQVQAVPPEQFDTVRVASGMLLSRVAAAVEVSVAAIQDLNPQLLASRTPPAAEGQRGTTYPVRVPKGTGVSATQRLARADRPEKDLAPYVVRFGDTADLIAEAHGIATGRLQRLNGMSSAERLAAGTVLLVPRAAQAKGTASHENEVVVVPARTFEYSDRKRVFYQVRRGDTLADVASAFSVSRSELIAWNALDDSARLQGDMVLQVFVKQDASLDRVRHLVEGQARVLVAGSPDFFAYFEGLKGKKRVVVTVQHGDTLSRIGRRYGMSIGWMERVNRRSRSDALVPGETIVVYVPRSSRHPGATTDSGPAARPLAPIEPPRPEALPPLQAAPAGAPSTAAFPDAE